MSRRGQRLGRREIPAMLARLMLGFIPAGLLTDAIVGDRHAHAVAWALLYGVLFGTAFWAAERLRTSQVSAGRWWLALLIVSVALTLLPAPADSVLAAVTLATLSALAARAPRRTSASGEDAEPQRSPAGHSG